MTQPITQNQNNQTPNTLEQTTPKKKSFDITQGIWLTQAQKIYIQHKLPKMFSLIQTPNNSRLVQNSKMLEEESIQFMKNKRGRPQGSYTRNVIESPTKSRKSIRLSNRKHNVLGMKQSQGSQSSQGQQNEQLYSVSYKQLQFSRSASKYQLIGDMKDSELSAEKPMLIKNKHKSVDQQQNEAKQKKLDSTQGSSLRVEKTKNQWKVAKQKNKIVQKIQQPLIIKEIQQIQKIKEVTLKQLQLQRQTETNKQPQIQLIASNLQTKQIKQHQRIDIKEKLEDLQSKTIETKFANELQIINKLKAHQNILPFLEPVDQTRDGAPDYYSIISDPIDIQTIEFKLNNNIYKDPEEFHQDIKKMWNNARIYNTNSKFMLRVTNSLQKYYCKLSKSPRTKNIKNKAQSKKITTHTKTDQGFE